MRHFRRHADALAQRGVGVDGLADVHRIGAHLDGQGNRLARRSTAMSKTSWQTTVTKCCEAR